LKNKILIVTECFYPEEFKINEVAIEWKNKGYEVDVLTTVPTYPESKIYDGYQNKWYQRDEWNGINIYRVKAVTGYKTSLFKKLLKYFSFMFFGSILSLKISKKYDYIFGFQVGALSSMFPAVILQKFYKKPVTLWIQDIWPDSVYAYGFKKTKVLQYILDKFVKFTYKHTSNFAISGQGFKNRVLAYINDNQSIEYCPNWADEIDLNVENIQLSTDTKIHFTFAGNIGKVQNLENVISAFGALDNEFINKAQLNIIGDGSELNNLKDLVNKNHYKNIVFHGRKPRVDMSKYLNASNFLIVSLVDKPIFSLTVPAKTQTYIAAKKPILAILKGDGAKIIKDNNLGYISDPNNIQAIQDIFIKAINTDNDQIVDFTKNCDILNNTIFNKDNIINNLLNLTTKN
jgi:glycosyltransferase involved in cell wall biosynthesis